MDQGAKPKAYHVGRLEGGELPELGKLVSDTFAEFGDNIGPYVLAGLGLYLVTIPIALVAVFVGYFVGGVGFVGVALVGGVIGSVVGDNVDQGLGALVMVGAQLLSVAVLFLMIGVIIVGIVGLLAPINASLARAVAAHQRGEKPLELQSAFSSMGRDVVPVIVVTSAVTLLAVVLALFCYFPALAVTVLFPFAGTLVALHGDGAGAALRKAFAHARANLGWYVPFGLLFVVVTMVGANVPVVGPAFLVALQVRAFRHVFGDGPAVV
jgi:hypothetical protein